MNCAQPQSPAIEGSRLPAHRGLPMIFGVALATGFSGAVVPGSLLAVVVRESVRVGWAAGPVMMIGHGLLELVAIMLLMTGLIRFARPATARGLIGLVGGGVLIYLGYETALIPAGTASEALRTAGGDGSTASGWLGLVWLGALMSMVNPYWWLWWATIGTAHTAWAVQRGRLGAGAYFTGHVLSDVLWYTAVSIALGTGRALLSAGALKGIYLGCAAFLIALGAIFAAAAVRTLAREVRQSGQRGAAS